MRVATFIRFARDTQMLTSRLTSTMIELEVVRLAREKRIEEHGGKDSTVEGHTIMIDFSDFLALLDVMATKVYPLPQDATEEAKRGQLRRLLLENVLLFASRREIMSFVTAPKKLPQYPNAAPPPSAESVMSTYRPSLSRIFKYYAEKANKRRSMEASAEVAKKGLAGKSRRSSRTASSEQGLRDPLGRRTDTIGYPEYMQFCTDFSLRSTSLLTAIQVGELYLNAVSLDVEARRIQPMTEPRFLSMLANMAMLAYRNCHASVLPHNKVKALLNFMWRGVNCNEKVDRHALDGRGPISSSHAGSLNMYGAGAFSDFFLAQWIGEPTGEDLKYKDPDEYKVLLLTGHLYPRSMPDYTAPIEEPRVDGKMCLNKIVKDQRVGTVRMKEIAATAASSSQTPVDASVPPLPEAISSAQPAHLHDFQLAALFRLRPEIAELAYLEIRNMFSNLRSEGVAMSMK